MYGVLYRIGIKEWVGEGVGRAITGPGYEVSPRAYS